jgi:hypothetical protein
LRPELSFTLESILARSAAMAAMGIIRIANDKKQATSILTLPDVY